MNYNNQTFSKGLWGFFCFVLLLLVFFNHIVVLNGYIFF